MKKKCKQLLSILFLSLLVTLTFPTTAFAAKPTPGKVQLNKISAPAYNKINISWKKAKNATHYKIYYKKSGTSKWNYIYTIGASKSSYTHTSNKKSPITVGQKYTYTVKAYNSKYKTNGKYDSKGKTIATKPSTVKLNSAKLNSNKTVTVKWNKTNSCDSYKVYRKTGSSGWKYLATTKSTSYTDKKPVKGTKNAYTVRSYYSKTKTYGNYNTKGISVSVPSDKPSTVKVTDVKMETPYSITLTKDNPTYQLKARVYPDNATNKKLIWSVYGMDAVQVDSNGKISIKESYLSSNKNYSEVGNVIATSADNPNAWDGPTVNVRLIFENDAETSQYPAEVLRLVNEYRTKCGLPPVQYHEKVQKAAMIRAKELEVHFEHERPDGRDSESALWEVGAGGGNGENIAKGQRTPETVMYSWLHSPGHRAAIIDGSSKYLGVGFHIGADGTRYWIQMFVDEPDVTYTFSFNTMGGSPVKPLIKHKGETIYEHELPTPSRAGYTFGGWYTSPDYYEPSKYVGQKMVTSNDTVYAKWIPE